MATATASRPSSRRSATRRPDDPVTAYARAVVDGRIVAGRPVRLACQRHLDDLTRGPARGLRWDPAAAQHAIDFFPEFLTFHEGVHAGQPFVLEPWQQFIIGSLFGWKGPDGYRRFRTGYVEVGKGNGKTPIAGGIALYGLMADGEEGAEIYAAAVTRDQAGICFRDAYHMAKASPDLAAELDILEHNIAHLASGSFFRPVSSEARSLDGKRVHIATIDELHEHPSALVVDKMRAGTKGRRQALIFEITNSGFDRLSVCWQHHLYALQVLEGAIADDALFAYVCQLDVCDPCREAGKLAPTEGCPGCDDFRDPAVWPKANPNLGVSITEKYLRELVREAAGMPAKLNIVLRLNFCVWTETHSRWLDMTSWAAGAGDVPDAELVGAPCYAGLDLGQSDDLSAFLRVHALPDGRHVVRCRFWIAEAALAAFPNRPYATWRRGGWLTVTEGNVTDYDQVEREVLAECQAWGVRELGYDNRFAEQMALHLAGAGVAVIPVPQGFQLNEALVALADLVRTGKLVHGRNPILAWMAGNAVVRHGQRGDIRLDKDRAADKIDGIAALAMAESRLVVRTEGGWRPL